MWIAPAPMDKVTEATPSSAWEEDMPSDAVAASLWRHADFMKLWAAQSISQLGARITREGLPFAVVMSLGATPAQVGLLAALSRGPAIVVGLTLGGFVDRRRRRPVMVWSDIGRAAVLASIPLAAWARVLTMTQLYVVAATVGALSVLFDIADRAFLPSLVADVQLVDANAKLATTDAVAEIGGPALYGVLFQIFTAPLAIAFNAGSYVLSALALGAIGHREPPPTHEHGVAHNVITDFRTGSRTISGDAVLTPLLILSATSALFGGFFSALYMLFALRIAGLNAGMLGSTVAVGGAAALVGASLAPAIIRRFGLGRTIALTGAAAGLGNLFVPLASGAPWMAMGSLIIAQILGDSFGTVTMIAQASLRQQLTDRTLMGRVGGVFATLPGVTGVVGALGGGWLGAVLGARWALWIACAGLLATAVYAFFTPLMARSANVEPMED